MSAPPSSRIALPTIPGHASARRRTTFDNVTGPRNGSDTFGTPAANRANPNNSMQHTEAGPASMGTLDSLGGLSRQRFGSVYVFLRIDVEEAQQIRVVAT